MGSKFNHKCLLKRQEENIQSGRLCEDGGSNCSNTATSQGKPEATRSCLEPLEGTQPCWPLDFGLLASQTLKE